jgi:hypothetical protein
MKKNLLKLAAVLVVFTLFGACGTGNKNISNNEKTSNEAQI